MRIFQPWGWRNFHTWKPAHSEILYVNPCFITLWVWILLSRKWSFSWRFGPLEDSLRWHCWVFRFSTRIFCRFCISYIFLTNAIPEGFPTALSRSLTLITNVVCHTIYCTDNISRSLVSIILWRSHKAKIMGNNSISRDEFNNSILSKSI